MIYGSLFSGLGGIDLAFDRAGMQCGFQAERDANCLKVLSKHWPDAPRFTDVCDVTAAAIDVRPDAIVGGFPCQDLSVAGRRAGLAGSRSGLFWEFVRILGEFRSRWVLLENVPGLLSSNEGRDMRAVVDALGELGYGWAFRVTDAQWFGVPQRRRRVFIVGCLGDFRRAARVLFEPESLPWDSPPRRQEGTRVAAGLTSGSASGSGVNRPGRRREDDMNLAVARAVTTREGQRLGQDQDTLVTHALTGEGFDASEDGTGRGTPLVPFQASDYKTGDFEQSDTARPITTSADRSRAAPVVVAYQCQGSNVGPMGTLRAGNGNETGGVPFAFQSRVADNGRGAPSDTMFALTESIGKGGQTDRRPQVSTQGGVRRLMPVECQRLQGLPDDWFDGLGLSNSAKYRMCGNSVAVPCVEWIARRIAWQSEKT
jgi:DNA (cytosine-5)-methyltransferase 1